MKTILFLTGCTLGLCLMAYFGDTAVIYKPMKPNKEVLFILESVKSDTMLQKMIIDPTYRVRVRQAEKGLR